MARGSFNVPNDWEVSTNPSGSVQIDPFGELEVEVIVRIPCTPSSQAADILRREGSGVPTINVEAYSDGRLVGGVEIRIAPGEGNVHAVNLPLVLKRW